MDEQEARGGEILTDTGAKGTRMLQEYLRRVGKSPSSECPYYVKQPGTAEYTHTWKKERKTRT